MASLKNQLRSDLTSAMKSSDAESVRTIRMILTAITQAEVSGTQSHELSAEEEVAILSTELKRRKESAQAYTEANRLELAEAELAEADVIQRYLPQPLSDSELHELVSAAVEQAASEGLTGGRAMGAVMKSLKPATAGKVDGTHLAAVVKSTLGIG